MVTSSRVGTDRRRPARIRETLVEIRAFSTNSLETVLTEALIFDALRVVHAVEVRFAEGSHVNLSDSHSKEQNRNEYNYLPDASEVVRRWKGNNQITCSQATVGLGLALYPGGQTHV